MKLFKKNENKKTTKLPMTGKVKKGFRYYCMAVIAMTFVLGTSVTAFAANDPIQVVNNLSDFIFGLVRAVGMISSLSQSGGYYPAIHTQETNGKHYSPEFPGRSAAETVFQTNAE